MTSTRSPGRRFQAALEDTAESPEWDAFVEASPDGHHEQTSRWGQVRSRHGWQVSRMILREGGRIVAGAQFQIRSLGRWGRWAYVTHGPCVVGGDPVLDNAAILEIRRQAHSRGVLFLVVGLPYAGHRLVPLFTEAGFRLKAWRLPPNYLQATSVIKLTLPSDQILANMRRSTRRNVRQALRKGLAFRECSGEDLAVFHRLLCALCERRGTTPNPANPEFLFDLWRHFWPKGWIRLFFVTYEDDPVSAALAITFQDWFRVWKVGWSGRLANLKPNEGMWWQLIQRAQQEGFRFFDFVEVDPDHAREVLACESDERASEDVTSFKLGFGGEIRLLPGAYYYVFSPFVRALLRCGFANLLRTPAISKLACRFGR